ncbi:Acyl-CoA dehydrogenase [Clavibacter michiganensis]|uniref:Acyl-CoA dehydrogenase n=1 Tax=Clavibacter michiganensis TaxID=28447 RepID=A0A251YFP8_9MICO|nr:acyl-CoA dehydrogenase family protein [Clavibacter michiganensis]OUE22983.1 Acyl-CoA dehydrogenase [Clavibacter michiganensis]
MTEPDTGVHAPPASRGRDRRLALGASFEAAMGDAWGSGPFGYAASRQRDEDEREASEEYRALRGTGFLEWTVPASAGGRAVDVDETFLLTRLLSRRDQTLAVTAMATSVGYLPVWVDGTDAQRRELGARVLAGDRVAFALSEEAHGSDVLANETVATRDGADWRVSGRKEGIGNAPLARFLTCVARTGARPGPGSLSILLVDRTTAGGDPEAVRSGRTWRLTGLRGFALGDVSLRDAHVPASGLVGQEGHGLETILRSGQVARALITALPLGGADTSLRLALDFARWRRIFGRTVAESPYSRRQLAECFAQLLFAESANTTAIRGIQAFPGHASILSSAVKHRIPRQLAALQDVLTDVLGARHFDRDAERAWPHAKAVRDGRVAHFADGNGVVALKVVAAALDRVLPADVRMADVPMAGVDDPGDALARVADLDAELPGFRPERQTVAPQGADVVTVALADAARRLAADAAEPGPAGDLARRVTVDLDALWELGRAARLRHAARARSEGAAYLSSAHPLRTAELGCVVVMAGCAAAAWAGNPRALGDEEDTLAVFALGLALQVGTADDVDDRIVERVMGVAERLHAEGRLFSHLPVQLAPEREAPPWR